MPDSQALELDKNAGNLWTEQIPLIADCLRKEAKLRSKSKHALAKREGEAGEKRWDTAVCLQVRFLCGCSRDLTPTIPNWTRQRFGAYLLNPSAVRGV